MGWGPACPRWLRGARTGDSRALRVLRDLIQAIGATLRSRGVLHSPTSVPRNVPSVTSMLVCCLPFSWDQALGIVPVGTADGKLPVPTGSVSRADPSDGQSSPGSEISAFSPRHVPAGEIRARREETARLGSATEQQPQEPHHQARRCTLRFPDKNRGRDPSQGHTDPIAAAAKLQVPRPPPALLLLLAQEPSERSGGRSRGLTSAPVRAAPGPGAASDSGTWHLCTEARPALLPHPSPAPQEESVGLGKVTLPAPPAWGSPGTGWGTGTAFRASRLPLLLNSA